MEQFSIQTEIDLHNILKRSFFKEAIDREKSDSEILAQETLQIIDSAKISMIIGKTEKAKRFLLRYFEREIPNPEFKCSKEGDVKLSLEQLDWIIPFLRISTEDYSVKIQIKNDFPATFETDNFKIILAPVVI